MTNKKQSTLTLVDGGEYITRTGEKVTMSIDKHCKPGLSYHQFFGSNGFYYKTNGMLFNDQEYEADVISEVPKLYTAKELLSAMSDSYNNGKAYGRIFSTSELQSLIQMQSKVITALEAEILELKETAVYLGNCLGLVNRVNTLRKQTFNEITTKKKRLVKIVQLQTKLKRAK